MTGSYCQAGLGVLLCFYISFLCCESESYLPKSISVKVKATKNEESA